jgi:5-formyltetrahydrofolate cyclo-ligase
MDKKALRKEVRATLAAMPDDVKLEKSTMLALALVVHPWVRDARVVALFSPLGDEPQIGEIIDVISQERTVVLPRIIGDEMEFYAYSPSLMCKGAYGIMEPVCGEAIAPEEIDVMIVPGVVFTPEGGRCGRGKGYYDKYMSRKGFRAHTIGVCYEEQISSLLHCETHDVAVNEVIYR